ncbi:DUF4336 domain-containing protein [Rhodoblastus acidophilus]|uniref:DUF4336 domain-containing protein n=1 Tax=Candidatus Rhodoblastus alkanivorans TaxID=2954117 RepID=A0ABS9Z4D9_9HYPH|nr:DUF4336 domain-containing protein [Candidatus Rhodoblastus alkanivorans]MCI4682543.1 DUF4336 domain-containing protein [Candidatus Rhodoblastus alkanivorans]MDI4639849.1 DUF4336 domain-containing protein [Rhodoblastus acidophilus]
MPFIGGFHYPTRMVAIRLADGRLFVWSPIELTTALKAQVESLGPVACLVSPNLLHHLYLGEWKAAFPAARLFASPGLKGRRKVLAFDAELGDAPDPLWAADIDQVFLRGSFVMTEAVFFHRASKTAIFADLIENFPPGWFKRWRGFVARLDGIVAPNFGAPREWRASFLRRRLARESLRRILDWPIEKVVIAHGDCAEKDGAAFVRRGFSWLM